MEQENNRNTYGIHLSVRYMFIWLVTFMAALSRMVRLHSAHHSVFTTCIDGSIIEKRKLHYFTTYVLCMTITRRWEHDAEWFSCQYSSHSSQVQGTTSMFQTYIL